MLKAIAVAWRARRKQAEITTLASRLGPHIARDIGIVDTAQSKGQAALDSMSPRGAWVHPYY